MLQAVTDATARGITMSMISLSAGHVGYSREELMGQNPLLVQQREHSQTFVQDFMASRTICLCWS